MEHKKSKLIIISNNPKTKINSSLSFNNTNTNTTITDTPKKPESEPEEFQKKESSLTSSQSITSSLSSLSLQENFKNFRSFINEQRKKNKAKKKITQYRENPERMLQLRKKFVQTAKSLIGIPYGKKYLLNNPDYKGDLFLDCCGLVRHCVNLLKEDFGFSLQPWNQAYQFDLLPEEIEFKQMKPGDLIFYTGTFYPDKCLKPWVHDMTHVEIFLGEGEKTIASREVEGCIKIYDTFQFVSQKYYNIKYHFKSIDTWLKGIYKSFCPEHKWRIKIHKQININRDFVNKYSAFYENEENDEQNEKKEKNEGNAELHFHDLENKEN